MNTAKFTHSPWLPHLLILAVTLTGLSLTSRYSYLLFHSIAELFSVVVAFAIFIIGWAARRSMTNGYVLFLGVASLFVACLSTLHLLAFKGMGVFTGNDANLPTQLWIASRYLLAGSLLLAVAFLRRKPNPRWLFIGFSVITAAALASIFAGWFPTCYIEGQGLTPFKIVSEYMISALFLGAAGLLLRDRHYFDVDVLRWLVAFLGMSVISEVAFTSYISVFGLANQLGHLVNLVAYYCLFNAIVETGFFQPFRLLLHDLRRDEEALHQAHATLERRVEERTAQLETSNTQLRTEIDQRQRIQAELIEVQRRLIDSKEDERLSLARELHDGPIQDLLAANFHLQELRLQSLASDQVRLDSIQNLILQVNRTLRSICGELRPVTLAPFGLEKALRSEAESFEQEHPELRLYLDLQPDGKQLPESTRLALFRIGQQALNNTAKHAGATQVWLGFGFDDEQIWIEVEDNGKGFTPPDGWIQLVREGHMGLAGMAERAEALGGKLTVVSSPGGGTQIRAWVPRGEARGGDTVNLEEETNPAVVV